MRLAFWSAVFGVTLVAVFWIWRQTWPVPGPASLPQRSAVAPVAATPPSWEVAPPPKPYWIVRKQGSSILKVGVPRGSTLEQMRGWTTEIMRSGDAPRVAVQFYSEGKLDVDHMIASYSNGTLYDTRDK